MELSVGDAVELEGLEDRGESFSGPGVVSLVGPRGCMVDVGDEVSWWVPRRFWGTSLRLSSGSTAS